MDAATRAQRVGVELMLEARMIRNEPREIRDLLRSRLVMVSRGLPCQRAIRALLEKYHVPTSAALPELPSRQAELPTAERALLKTHVRRLDHELRDRMLDTPDAQRLV